MSGPAEVERIAPPDRIVAHGDSLALGGYAAQVIDVSGHTNGHVAYYLPDAGLAFVGDAVFALGCGRMFEGQPDQFWASLCRIKALPPATLLYCAHEYTQSNARFALHADPDNAQLRDYAAQIERARADGLPTVPTPLSRELATNPFLRADDPDLQARWASQGGKLGDSIATFAALRAAKDTF